jgi:hypothetical protein
MDPGEFHASRFISLLSGTKNRASESDARRTTNLPLPENLGILYSQTEIVLQNLLLLKRRKQTTSLSRLREIVEAETRHSFTERTLRQVLRILPPGTIATEWKQDARRTLPHYLIVNLVSSDEVKTLLSKAADFLLEFVKNCHNDFLLSIGESSSQICTWHARFDLTSVPEITPVTLDPPEIKLQRTIHEAFSLPQPSADPSIQIPSSCANIESYVQIAKRIREKEASKERIAAVEEHQKDLLVLSDSVHTLFYSRRKTSVPLPDVIANLQKTQRFLNRDGKKLNLLVEELISKSDGYFQETQLGRTVYVLAQSESVRPYQIARGIIVRNVSETIPK